MHPSQILITIAILALVAALMVGMLVDLDRLRRDVELDELWDDEIDAGRGASDSSGAEPVATTPAAGIGDLLGGAA